MNSHELGRFPIYEQHQKGNEDLWDPSVFMPTPDGSFSAPVTGLEPGVNAVNMNYMDEAFYDQMSFMFTSPFSETPDPHTVANNEAIGLMSGAPTGQM